MIDVTEKKAAERSLQDSEARLRRSQQAGGVGSYEWLMDGSGGTQSEEMLRLIGLDPHREYSFKEVLQTVVPEDKGQVFETIASIQGGTVQRETHYRVNTSEGIRWIRDVGQLDRDDEGNPYRWIGIIQDVTEQRSREEAQRLLVNELNHRVKNTLAVVQAIAHQTFKPNVDPETARSAFEGRLISLAAAHDVLTAKNWGPVPFLTILNATANALSLGPDRLELLGAELLLSAKTALTLSLVLHELATNAIKFGSLKEERGTVCVKWVNANGVLRFTWEEKGGPPPPKDRTRGFGTRMVEQALAAELNGSAEWQYRTSGLRCIVSAPLPQD